MSREKHQQIKVECLRFEQTLREQFAGPLPTAIAWPLDTLQLQGDRLLLTWSVMAGRNILNDMLRTVRNLENQLTGPPKAAATEFKAWLERELAGHAVTRARYDSVLCLGYKVKTHYSDGYRGKVDDYEDLLSKCRDMTTAIQAARNLLSADEEQDRRMLKIFMAPEFFFRGANGGYDYDVVLGLGDGQARDGRQGLLGIMQQEIRNAIYNDWLFVLGTVVAVSQNTRLVCKSCNAGIEVRLVDGVSKPVCRRDPTHVLEHRVRGAWVDNIAYVCKESEVHTVSKELIAKRDFMVNESAPNYVRVRGRWTEVNRYEHREEIYSASSKPTRFKDERMGGCIFTLDGVTFGLEVCMDHAYSTRADRSGRLDHAGNIQIQLIPSAGMFINQLRTLPRGVVFNVDSQPAVQIVAKRQGRIHVFESCGKHRVTVLDRWQPRPIIDRLNPFNHLNRSSDGWHEPSDVRATSAPNGSIVRHGPFEIPKA